jgi:diguanylate cyclase (GGDEF)-like protein
MIVYIALQVLLFPFVYKIDLYNLFFELSITIAIFISLINLQKLKYNTEIHKYLISGFFFLFVTSLTNTLDEIFVQPWLLTILFEDTGQLLGYLLVASGINLWIKQNSSHSFKLKKLSETDELTGLFSRRHFNGLLDQVLTTQHIQANAFSILLINIDNFKLVNERYNQAAGDLVIKRLANKLKDCVRKTDTVARWGGEEFSILLNSSNNVIATQVAETIRTNVELLCVEYSQDILNVTVSIGVATYDKETKASELINHAEQALAKAKQNGKNQICLHGVTEKLN